MKQYICQTKCYHGKVWQEGEKTTEAFLKKFGKIPKHFTPVGGKSVPDVKTLNKVKEYRNFLRAHSVPFAPNLGLEKLKALVEKTKASNLKPRNVPQGGIDPLD